MDEKDNPWKSGHWECVYCGMTEPSEATFISFNMNQPKDERGQVGMVYWTCDFCKETKWKDDPKPFEVLLTALKDLQDKNETPVAT